ncbi:hypothetical protein [Phyllobacterium ifriqiyense]
MKPTADMVRRIALATPNANIVALSGAVSPWSANPQLFHRRL